MGIWLLFIAALVVSVIIVNVAQALFMKILGANIMFFRGRTKVVIIIALALFLAATFSHRFGIQIPGF